MSDRDLTFRNPQTGPAGFDRMLADEAIRLHRIGRRRARHFGVPMLLDHGMNMMLSLLIAEIEQIVVSEDAVLLANEAPADADPMLIDTLVHAGLAAATGTKPGRRLVGLTPLGSARMRGFVTESLSS